MFARRSVFGPKNKANLGAENEAQNGFPLRAANQAVLGLFLGPHFGLRFGANLDLGLDSKQVHRKKEVSSYMQGSPSFSLKCNTVWIRRLQG